MMISENEKQAAQDRPSEEDEEEEEAPTPNLWVGNLSADTTDKDLMALFGKYGTLDSVTAYTPRNNYAFVYFKRLEDAKASKETLQGALVRGNSIKIDFAKPKLIEMVLEKCTKPYITKVILMLQKAKPCKHLWVGGVSPTLTKEQLKEEFSKFGEIEDIKIIRDRNSALVEYYKLEDASDAVKNMNGKSLGGEHIRVDFVRSQPGRRDLPDHDPWIPPDATRIFAESSQHGPRRPLSYPKVASQNCIEFREQQGRKEVPSKILWVGYPPTVIIDEQMLHNAMILFGEIERIKTFPNRHYAFVEFRSVDEARRAKEGLQGRLFNDSRIQIMFSHSEFAPLKEGSPFYSSRGPRTDIFSNEPLFGAMDMLPPCTSGQLIGPNDFPGHPYSSNMHGFNMAVKPFSLQGYDPLPGFPEFSDPGLSHKFPDGGSIPWRRSSPPLPHIINCAPGIRPYFRPTQRPWANVDTRDPKRSRLDAPVVIDDVILHTRIGDPHRSPQLDIDAVGHPLGSSLRVMGPITSTVVEPHSVPRRDHCWRGLIAKGGTSVCRSRCIPIGKGIASPLPEVVNCSARTGLDMLSKHYAEASGFDIVFFLPDSEDDFDSYTEFLRYLGVKSRAGVAKLDDGTTLFLVPPSDFLFNVLNVSGPERLYGVVLKLPQPSALATMQLPQEVSTTTSQFVDRRPPVHISYGLASQDDRGQREENNRVLIEDSSPHAISGKPPLIHAEESHIIPVSNQTTNPSAGSNVDFTPELFATLASLVPPNIQTSATGTLLSASLNQRSFAGPAVFDKAMPPQGQGQDCRMLEGSRHQEQIHHPQIQFGHQSTNLTSVAQFPYHASIVNPSDPSGQVPGNVETQGLPVKQHVIEVAPRQMGNYTYPTQGAHYSATPHNQQYQVDNAYTSHNSCYGMAQTSNMGGAMNQFCHQSIPSTSVPNQSWPLPQPQGIMPSLNDNLKSELPTQLLQLQAALSSSSHGPTLSEDDKNQCYQSTLQFAASLLMQIQQQQQQGGAESVQGSGKQQ